MIRGVFLLFLFYLSQPFFTMAQVPALIVTAKGDSLMGYIEEPNPTQVLRQILFYPNPDKENPQKFLPRTLQVLYFQSSNTTDTQAIRSMRLNDSYVFGWIVENGPLQLIEVANKEKVNGKSTLKWRYYLLDSLATEVPDEIQPSSFRRVAGRRIKDHVRLQKDLNAKVYEFEQRAQLVADYNRWVRAGKPANSWTEENGNYTLKEDPGPTIKAKRPEPEESTESVVFNFEAGGYLGLGLIQYDEFTFNTIGLRFSSPGPGYQVQVGGNLDWKNRFLVRAGLNLSAKGLRVSYQAEVQTDSTTKIPIQLTETWNMTYLGGYTMFEYHQNEFFLGGGFDFTFHPFVRNRTSGSNGSIEIDDDFSLLFNSPLNQFDLVLSTGFTLSDPMGNFRIKPLLTYHLPVQNLLEFKDPLANITGLNQYPLAGISFRLGIVVDFKFK
jgi:hypothetical protein